MKKRNFFESLKGIVLSSFFMVFVIVVIILVYSVFKYIFPIQNKQYKFQVEATGNMIVSEIEKELYNAKYLAFTLTNPMKFIQYDEKKFKNVLENVIKSNSEEDKVAGGGVWPEPFMFSKTIERRSFFWGRNKKGELIYYDDYNNPEGNGYHNEEWYEPVKFLKDKNVIWSRVYRDPYTNQLMSTCSTPIYVKGKFAGVSTVDLKLEWLNNFFQEAAKSIQGYVLVVGNYGEIISTPESLIKEISQSNKNSIWKIKSLSKMYSQFEKIDKINKEINDKNIEEVFLKYNDSKFIADEIGKKCKNLTKDDILKMVISIKNPSKKLNAKSNKILSFSIDNDLVYNETAIVTLFSIPETNWKMFVVIPESVFTGSIRSYIYKILGFSFLILFLALAGVFLIINSSIIFPVNKILETFEQLKSNNGNSEHISSDLNFQLGLNNELGDLAKLIEERTNEIYANERKYKAVFDSSTDAIFVHTEKGEIIDVNEKMLKMFNVGKKEIVLENSSVQFWSSESNPFEKLPELFENVASGNDITFQWKAKKYTGEEFDTLVHLKMFKVKKDKFIYASVRDVSELKRIEMELLRTEKYASEIFDQSPLSMQLIDKNGLTVSVNKAWEDLWKVEKEKVIGKYNLLKEKYTVKSGWAKEVEKALNGETAYILEKEFDPVRTELKYGRKRIVSTIIFPILDENNKVLKVVATHKDVTVEVEIRENLEAEREKLSVTLRSIGDGVITTDTNGKVEFINKTAEVITGFKLEEAKGKNITEVFNIIDGETKVTLKDPVSRVMEKGSVVELQENTTLISNNGMLFNIGDSAAPIKNKNGETIGVVIVFRDISEKMKNEEELTKLKKLESLGVLAGGIAHDFNNLLTGLTGNISVVKNMLNKESKEYEYILNADNALDNAIELTRKLLTFSKGGDPVRQVVDLGKTIIESAKFSSTGSKMKIKNLIRKDLKKAYADKGQVDQVISNIVINSIQAAKNPGNIFIRGENFSNIPQKKVELKAGEYIKISIKDDGPGIDPNNLKNIFDPYFTTKEQGTGLGLASVFSIMKKHNGLVEVNSVLGEGAEFILYFPAADIDEKEVFEKPKVENIEEESKQLNILLMDDDSIVREMAESVFEVLNHNVDMAVDGDEAIRKYVTAKNKNKPFDVVIMDLTIPGGKGGKETIVELLKIDSKAKVIVSSGYSNDPIMANYKKYGFLGRLKKPYRIYEMKEVLAKVMS